MPAFIDLTGQKFGKLTAIKRVNNKGNQTRWLCRCDCGNETIVSAGALRSCRIRTCGCSKKRTPINFIDLTGKVFERLTVIGRAENIGKIVRWNCLCECGNKVIVPSYPLKSGATKSCGCYIRDKTIDKNYKHGYKKRGTYNPTYNVWLHIKDRTSNKKNSHWKYYGGRGIKVCDRWIESFQNFYDDMGPKPSRKHSIDRIDNDGDYTPENCRWATAKQQANNMSSNIKITIDGKTKTLTQWCRINEIKTATAFSRMNILGWPPAKAVTQPVKKIRKKK